MVRIITALRNWFFTLLGVVPIARLESCQQTLKSLGDAMIVVEQDSAKKQAIDKVNRIKEAKASIKRILVIDDSPHHLEAARRTLGQYELTCCSSHAGADELLSYRGPQWDAVLCDLLMPAGGMEQGYAGNQYVGQEMPVGWSLALRAAAKNVPFVAVLTDTNHHHHPASAMLDEINEIILDIDGTKMLMTNCPLTKVILAGTEGTQGKNWGELLDWVVTGERPEYSEPVLL